MKLRHRVRTSATPAQVWSVLGDPARWPDYDLSLRKVHGSSRVAMTGQHLLGVLRGGIRRADRRRGGGARAAAGAADALRAGDRRAGDVRDHPAARGGSDLVVSVVVEGLFARIAALPMWLGSGITSRILAARVDRIARAARRAA